MTRRLAVLLIGMAMITTAQQPSTQDSATVSTSGNTATFNTASAGATHSLEYKLTGGPATVSIIAKGCMRGGTCTTKNTYTTVADTIIEITGAYDTVQVTASWTGGSSPTVTVNRLSTLARSGGGGGASFVGLTTNAPVIATGATTAATPCTGCSIDASGNTVLPGTVSVGTSPPACTPGSSGAMCFTEGTAFTNVANAAGVYPDSTLHEFVAKTNGASSGGMLIRQQPGAINQTAKTAAISTASLCAAVAGACNQAGQYEVSFNFWGSGTACSNVTAGSVTFLLTWTDENAVAHSAVVIPMISQTGATSAAIGNSFLFQTALANEGASGKFAISTNGSVIQYATGYTACTTGTGTYNLRATVTRIQ